MTDQEIIELGSYAEDLLQQDGFGILVKQFEQQCFQHYMQTQPKDKMEREGIYAQFRGACDFLDHLRAAVDQKNETISRNAALSEQDAHIEGID